MPFFNLTDAGSSRNSAGSRSGWKGIRLVTTLDPGLWKVKIDQGQFEQAILNLAKNASDAMPGGGEVFREHDGQRLVLANLGAGDFFGEIDFRGNASRYASARAMGEVYVISLERKKFLQKFLDDPSLAFHVLEKMSERIRKLCEELDRLSTGTRP